MCLSKKPASTLPHRTVGTRLGRFVATGLIAICIGAVADDAEPAKETPADPLTASSFSIPASLQQGRDPFFPTSTRPLTIAQTIPEPVAGPAKIVLKGISGSTDKPLALINNRTFAVGDEQDVTTALGKVKVKCLSIDGMTVTVLVQGQIRELVLRDTLRAQAQPGQTAVGEDL